MAHIAIAGAGIGGLAAALALARSGHDVTVLERRPALGEAGAGLQLSPNATRILARWGLLEAVKAIGVELESIRIARSSSHRPLTSVDLRSEAARRFAAPFVAIHRADLHALLRDAALGSGRVTIAPGRTVTDVRDGKRGVTVTTAGAGSVVEADGFVDAGGFRTALGASGRGRTRSPWTAWRALVEAERCRPWLLEPCSNLWLGTRAHLVHYPIRSGTLVNIVAVVKSAGPADDGDVDVWSRTGMLSDLLPAFDGWPAPVIDLLRSAPSRWGVWPLIDGTDDHAPWSNGRCTRLGDSAHPMLPFLAQGASQTIEDADALVTGLTARAGDIPSGFRDYEAARQRRARRVQTASRRQGTAYHLGGAAALARDIVLRGIGSGGMLQRMSWLYGP